MRDYAEEQGLMPMVDALKSAGIPHSVENTGGNVMNIVIPLPDVQHANLGIIAASQFYGDPENPRWMLFYYDGGGAYDGISLAHGEDMEWVVRLVRAYVRPEETRASLTISEATLNQGHNPHTSFIGQSKGDVFNLLRDDLHAVPAWVRNVQSFRYLAEEVEELILLCATYPIRCE